MNDEPLEPMHPWFRGFNGQVIVTDKSGKYDVTGTVTKLDDTTLQITELPIHMWTKTFKAQLETMMVSEKGETPPVKVRSCHVVAYIVFHSAS
jgi:DNA topoisomerase II